MFPIVEPAPKSGAVRSRGENTTTQNKNPEGRLIARLLRELLQQQSFSTLADLTDALKRQCGRYKIRWSNDAISEAFRLVESNTALVRWRVVPVSRGDRDRGGPLNRAESARLYESLMRRYCEGQ